MLIVPAKTPKGMQLYKAEGLCHYNFIPTYPNEHLMRTMMTAENDIVLIYLEENPLAFARIESIEADIKPGWYHVKFLMLQIPLQAVTWILRDVYIDGEPYTMGGKAMRIEKVICPEAQEPEENERPEEKRSTNDGKVISLADLHKK
jgi:hypothetical protein